MLRITKKDLAGNQTSLRLDGDLSGPWVQELRSACEPMLGNGHQLQLGCTGVTYANSEGIELMRGLKAQGVEFVNCSPFIKLQLGLDAQIIRDLQ